MNLFTSQELEEKVCGLQGRFDRELLKGNTSYGDDYTSETPVIERFWTVISDIFTHEQKKLFLIFVSGRSTLPSCDANFSSRFVINRLDVSDGMDVDRILPCMSQFLHGKTKINSFHLHCFLEAYTCFFILALSPYTTVEIMYERLNYAFTYCCSIDADQNMNDEPTVGLIDDTNTST